MDDQLPAEFQYPPDLIQAMEQLILGEMLDDIKGNDHILGLSPQRLENLKHVSGNDPG